MSEAQRTSDQALREKAPDVVNAIQKVRESKPEADRDWIAIATEDVERLRKLLEELILLVGLAISGGKFIRHEWDSPEAAHPKSKERPPAAVDSAFLEELRSFSNRLTGPKDAHPSRRLSGGYITDPDAANPCTRVKISDAGAREAGGHIAFGQLTELDKRIKTFWPPAPVKKE